MTKNINIVNLTPHAVTFVTDNGNIVIPPSGTVARRETTTEVVGTINGIPVTRTKLGPITGLPETVSDDTVYVVSRIIAEEAGRNDLYIPDQTVRDDQGRIVGCRSLGIL